VKQRVSVVVGVYREQSGLYWEGLIRRNGSVVRMVKMSLVGSNDGHNQLNFPLQDNN